MTVLSDYQVQVTDLLHDTANQFYSSALVLRNINAARKKVAEQGMCIRQFVPPGTGVNQLATVAAQEVYTFASVNTIMQAIYPGVLGIMSVGQVSVSWGGFIPPLIWTPWQRFNAYYRSLNSSGVQGFPSVWAQYAQGDAGSIYLYPIPTQASAMLWDCCCLPIPLVDDTTVEAIPYPWTEAVQWWAVYLCYQNSQRKSDAAGAYNEYRKYMAQATSATMPVMVPNFFAPGSPPG